MSRKYIVLTVIGVVIAAVLSITIGINMGKGPVSYKTTPTPYHVSEATESALQTTVPAAKEKYTIRLDGNTLALYEDGKKINETEIAPHVLPMADIKALRLGLGYSTLENALMDWESLCK